jgi:hydroxymethylbilane synthase
MTPIRIGTRGSKLALWQANHVADRLRPLVVPRPVELVIIATAGDQVRDVPLAQIGGEGVFTKEIQRALLDGSVDVAVHSLKDLPTIPVAGLVLAAVPERGPTGDVFVSEKHRRFDDLPSGAVLATSSLRRRAQALYRRPDLRLIDIRGNVETRLRKLHDEGLDATILAEAGLRRLGLGSAVTEVLDPAWMLPAVGQGALGLECRADDAETLAPVRRLNHLPTQRAVLAERAMLLALGGGCQVPMGAVCRVTSELLSLRGAVVRPDGTQRIEAELSGSADDPEAVGRRVAEELLARGARQMF